MTKEKFNEVIDFAINGEKEAVEFYQELQQRTKFKARKDMLKEFSGLLAGREKIDEYLAVPTHFDTV